MRVLQAELERRKENERISFFEPNGAQDSFIKLVGSEDTFICIFSAANGVGKTSLVANLLGNLFYGSQTEYFQHPRFKDWKFPRKVRYVTESNLVEDDGPFQSEIGYWWPKGRYSSEKNGKSYQSKYKANGWHLDIMTYKQEPKEFEGGTYGLQIFDEPPDERIWNACISRVRKGGIILVLMTPLTSAAWFFDKIVPKYADSIVYAKMEDACKVHGIRGHLEHENIQRLIDNMPPDEVEARVYGKALYLRGLIFKTLDPKVHVLKEPVKVQPGSTIYQAVDPHSDKPFAAIWGMPDANGDVYIVDEYPSGENFYRMHGCQLTVKDYARIFRDKEADWNVSKRIMDRHFADVRNVVNRKTLREEFAEETGLFYDPSYAASEEVETGILKVRDYLKYDATRELSALNKPRLFISPTCTNTIKSLTTWARDPNTGKIMDAYKDHADCVRYLLMEDPKVAYAIPDRPVNRYG